MASMTVNGLSIAYEVVGSGRPWVITPGGRFSKDSPGVRELAQALAERGNRVLIWDRPNTGESDVCFSGENESALQADTLAALLTSLDMAPAVISGGSGGSRVSMLTASRHPGIASGLAIWWITGGVAGLMNLGIVYCNGSIRAAWNGGMEAVVALDEWHEVLTRNPRNRERFLEQDPREFIETLERWMLTYCPCGPDLVPGLRDDEIRSIGVPALVFRSGTSDPSHTRITSERVASLLPNVRFVEPPWPDTEWIDRLGDQTRLFVRWPLLAPMLLDWAEAALLS